MGESRRMSGLRSTDLGVPITRHRSRITETWRSLRVAAWLGWQIESNWADPFLFAVYSVVKPVAGALILVFMYLVVARGGLENPLFPYVFVGNAFYIYVGAVLIGISWAVIADREHYGMLKYMYVAPLNILAYLLGRGVAQTAIATVATTITLLFGVAALGIPIPLGQVDWGLLAAALVLGLSALAFMGLLLGGATLLTARHNESIGQGVAGALYLLSGVVFPLDVLPRGLQWVGKGLPVTYWLEVLRRALLGDGGNEALRAIPTGQVMAILAGSTVVLAVVSLLFFRWAEGVAHRRGLLDMQTMY
ncbi:TPA: ABC transporter [Candidatus Acetothermia bacterium]|nr:ABC transporter [Candidatus Acetothermia bacterium]